MNASADVATPMSKGRILALTASAALVGGLVLVAGVLPAEYHADPLGLGRLLGTDKLWAPKEVKISANPGGSGAAQRTETSGIAFRTDVVRILLAAAGDPAGHDKLEYKVRMKKGSALVYSWTVPDMPADSRNNFMTQMHGHTLEDEQSMTVVDYRLSLKDSDAGALTAAIDGIHGWYAENRSNRPVTMIVKLAGFYTLVPPGAPGNEAGILAEGVKQ